MAGERVEEESGFPFAAQGALSFIFFLWSFANGFLILNRNMTEKRSFGELPSRKERDFSRHLGD